MFDKGAEETGQAAHCLSKITRAMSSMNACAREHIGNTFFNHDVKGWLIFPSHLKQAKWKALKKKQFKGA